MDPVTTPAPTVTCACGCPCCQPSTWRRSMKRKLAPEEIQSPASFAAGIPRVDVAARVEAENEITALRETLFRQQQSIQELYVELDQEQNASSTAASEAMSMILRLQREKAEVQMEFRQFKRFAEERMAHDQRELAELDELLYKREQSLLSPSSDTKNFKNQTPEPDADTYVVPVVPPQVQFDPPEYEYPPLLCKVGPGEDDDDDSVDLDKYTPTTTMDRIQKLKQGTDREFEPEVLVRDKPLDEDTEIAIDAVYDEDNEMCDGYSAEDGDINSLYKRLQALEADRESMRHAIISMRTEKAQHQLLKEIAQQLCKEVGPERMGVVKKKPSLTATFPVTAVVRWVMSFNLWRKKASRSKYSFGPSKNNVGLLVLLDKSARVNQKRCITSTQR